MRKDAPGQIAIEYGLADAEVKHRRQRLDMALDRIGADLYLVVFCRMVFEGTGGGAEGRPWRRTADELRRRPDGLCCGETKLRSVLREAQSARLVRIFQHTDGAGRNEANGFAIDWDGVAWQLAAPAAGSAYPAPRATRPPGCAPPSLEDQELLGSSSDDSDDEDEEFSSSSSSESGSAHRGPATACAAAPRLGSQANRLLATLWRGGRLPPLADEDREFLFELLLVARELGEEWLWRAVERVGRVSPRPHRPLAYLRRTLAGDLADARGIGDEEAAVELRRRLRGVRAEARRIERQLRRDRQPKTEN